MGIARRIKLETCQTPKLSGCNTCERSMPSFYFVVVNITINQKPRGVNPNDALTRTGAAKAHIVVRSLSHPKNLVGKQGIMNHKIIFQIKVEVSR